MAYSKDQGINCITYIAGDWVGFDCVSYKPMYYYLVRRGAAGLLWQWRLHTRYNWGQLKGLQRLHTCLSRLQYILKWLYRLVMDAYGLSLCPNIAHIEVAAFMVLQRNWYDPGNCCHIRYTLHPAYTQTAFIHNTHISYLNVLNTAMIITLKAVHLCLDISNETSTVVWSLVEAAHNNAPMTIFPTKISKYPGSVTDGVQFKIASSFVKRLFFGQGARTINNLGRFITSCWGLIRTGHRNKNSWLLCSPVRTCILVVVLRTMIT